MEFSQLQIATLVLGYLKKENCKTAYKEFLRTSRYLKEHKKACGDRFFVTRVYERTLADYLYEYASIFTVVVGRLEASDYYERETNSRTTLVDKLLYLLNKIQNSRSPTPCPRTPESQINTCPSDVETTPAHTLPGNQHFYSEDSYEKRSPRKKNLLNTPEKIDAIDVFTKTLIENPELQEKLAHTINSVRNTPETIVPKKSTPVARKSVTEEPISNQEGAYVKELDQTIKTVLQRTEEDPVFEKILDEIIGGSRNVEESGTSATDQQVTSYSTTVRTSCTTQSTPPCQLKVTSTVEDQNEEAVRSIISAKTAEQSEVIVYDGSFDNYVKNNAPPTVFPSPVSLAPPTMTNTPLLMIPSNSLFQLDGSKQYFLLNNSMQPVMSNILPQSVTQISQTQISQTQRSQSNVSQTNFKGNTLCDQDIMAMPTVILNDQGDGSGGQQVGGVQPTLPKVTMMVLDDGCGGNGSSFGNVGEVKSLPCKKTVKVRKPKLKPKISNKTLHEDLNEYITLYSSQESNKSEASAQKSLEKSPDNPIVISLESEERDKVGPLPSNEETKAKALKNTVTPQNKGGNGKGTPKSGSHVRNLDFSTPPKVTSTGKRNNNTETKEVKSSQKFVHKKQAAKTLFKEAGSEPIKSDELVKKQSSLSWDADLRAGVCQNQEESKTPKRKHKASVSKRPKKVTKKSKEVTPEEEDLNNTENDALLLEAALRTPMKTDPDEQNVEIVKSVKTNRKALKKKAPEKSRKSSEAKNKSIEEKINEKVENKDEGAPQKTVLSPSRITTKTNKRNIAPEKTNEKKSFYSILEEDLNLSVSKHITPDMCKENVTFPIKANRNLTPFLETPLKMDFPPKTPGIGLNTPSTGFTPFTKFLDENLKGIDINNIQTPSLPITPSFAVNDLISPQYQNRPTDYSGSSSYYQPSDTEQNKSIEHYLDQIENKPKVNKKPEKEVKVISNVVLNKSESELNEKKQMFNKNVIGKKNLSLIKKNVESFSSTDSSSDEEFDFADTKSNDTVICKKDMKRFDYLETKNIIKNTEGVQYCLRKRSMSIPQMEENRKKEQERREKLKKKPKPKFEVPRKVEEKEMLSESSDMELEENLPDTSFHKKSEETSNIVEIDEKFKKSTNKKNLENKDKSVENYNSEVKEIVKEFKKPPNIVRKTPKKSSTPEKPAEMETIAKKSIESTDNVSENIDVIEGENPKENSSLTHSKSIETSEIKDILSSVNVKKTLHKKNIIEVPSHQEKVLKEMAEKRARVVNSFKQDEHKMQKNSAKTVENKKNRVENILEEKSKKSVQKTPEEPKKISDLKKKSRKSDSPQKKTISKRNLKIDSKEKDIDKEKPEESDTERKNAQVMVEGLKTWGIHLVYNKSPKKKVDTTEKSNEKEALKQNEKLKKLEEESKKILEGLRAETKKVSSEGLRAETKKVSSEPTKERLYTDRELPYQLITLENEISVQHDYSSKKPIPKTPDTKTNAKKSLSACVYFDKIDQDLPIKMNLETFNLFEEPSLINVLIPKKNKERYGETSEKNADRPKLQIKERRTINVDDDEIMNFACIGDILDKNRKDSPKDLLKSRKRKLSIGDDSSNVEKKIKPDEFFMKNLKTIDVDNFLNKVHGSTPTH